MRRDAGPNVSFDRVGTGQPMLLVHGIGHRRQMWRPLVDRLQAQFDMTAVDLPGFGESAPLEAEEEPTPVRFADELEALMTSLGWASAHLVGNSLGAWVSLELALRGRARSVTALMPAGLWRRDGGNSLRHRALFRTWETLAKSPGATTLIRQRGVRVVALAGLFGQPWKVPPEVAAGDAANLRRCELGRTMRATHGRRFEGGQDLAIPITVVLGPRDPLIRPSALDLSELPAHTRCTTLPRTGHVPTWDDPAAVAAVVLETTSAASADHR